MVFYSRSLHQRPNAFQKILLTIWRIEPPTLRIETFESLDYERPLKGLFRCNYKINLLSVTDNFTFIRPRAQVLLKVFHFKNTRVGHYCQFLIEVANTQHIFKLKLSIIIDELILLNELNR